MTILTLDYDIGVTYKCTSFSTLIIVKSIGENEIVHESTAV